MSIREHQNLRPSETDVELIELRLQYEDLQQNFNHQSDQNSEMEKIINYV